MPEMSEIQMRNKPLPKPLEVSSRKEGNKPGSKISYSPEKHGNDVTFENAEQLADLSKLTLEVSPNSRVFINLTMKDSTVRTISFANTAQSGESIKARVYLDPKTGEFAIAENDTKDKSSKGTADNPGPLSEKFHTRRKITNFKPSDAKVELTGDSTTGFAVIAPKPEDMSKTTNKVEMPKLTSEEKKLIDSLKELPIPEDKSEKKKLLEKLQAVYKKHVDATRKCEEYIQEMKSNNIKNDEEYGELYDRYEDIDRKNLEHTEEYKGLLKQRTEINKQRADLEVSQSETNASQDEKILSATLDSPENITEQKSISANIKNLDEQLQKIDSETESLFKKGDTHLNFFKETNDKAGTVINRGTTLWNQYDHMKNTQESLQEIKNNIKAKIIELLQKQ